MSRLSEQYLGPAVDLGLAVDLGPAVDLRPAIDLQQSLGPALDLNPGNVGHQAALAIGSPAGANVLIIAHLVVRLLGSH